MAQQTEELTLEVATPIGLELRMQADSALLAAVRAGVRRFRIEAWAALALAAAASVAACGGDDDGLPGDAGADAPGASDAGTADASPDAGRAVVPSVTVAAAAGTFQAECDAASSGTTVLVAYMDQRATSRTGAANAATIRLAVSHDAGRTFGLPTALDATRDVDQFDPTVAMLPDGRAFVGWFEDDGAGARHVRVARAPTADGPWTLAAPLDDGVEGVDRPWIAARGDVVSVAWVVYPSHRLNFTRSTDGGATFATPVASADMGFMLGCLAYAGDGALWVAACQYEGAFASRPRIVAARAGPGASGFEPPVEVARLSTANRVIPRCAPTSDGVVVGWPDPTGTDLGAPDAFVGRLFAARVSTGATPAPVEITLPERALAYPPPSIAVDSTGGWHALVYGAPLDATRADERWSAYLASSATGSAFDSVRVLSPMPAPGVRVVSPSPIRLDITTWLGDTSALVVADGAPVALFSENRTGDADLFAARVE